METPRTLSARPGARWAALFALVVVAVVFGALLYPIAHGAAVFPGVHVGGVDVGGLTRDQAAARLAAAGLLADSLALRAPDDGRTWPRPAAELGLTVDPEALAADAFAVGRTGWNPIARLFHPLVFPFTRPAVAVTARFEAARAASVLRALAPEVDRAPTNAAVEMVDGRLQARPTRLGQQLDISGTLRALALFAARPDSDTLDLAVQRTSARIPDLGNVALAYNTAVSSPLNVGWQSAVRFTIPVATLRAWVTVRDMTNAQGDMVPTVVFDQVAMARWLEERRAEVDRPPVNARFRFDDQGQLTVSDAGQRGLRLDVPASVAALERAAYTDVRVGELAVTEIPQAVGPTDLARLSQLEEIGRASTSLAGASVGRLGNLTVAAERLRGVAVAPGGDLSLATALGPVAASTGYDPVFLSTTVPDSTITQVCSTMLRTVWWVGLPILERHAPPVRLGWVEPPVGLDCAIAADQDFRFLNDSAGFIWFDVLVDRERGVLTVTLFGQPMNRRVDTVGPAVTKVMPPAAGRTIPAPALPAGLRVQTQWAREGAEAALSRTVTFGARTLARDDWVSRYAPAGDVVLQGTGAEAPTAAPTATP